MATITFRLPDEIKPKMEARAEEVRYRSVSDYLRELVEADLKKASRAPRQPQPAGD